MSRLPSSESLSWISISSQPPSAREGVVCRGCGGDGLIFSASPRNAGGVNGVQRLNLAMSDSCNGVCGVAHINVLYMRCHGADLQIGCHYLCAYCELRLPQDRSARSLAFDHEGVEHSLVGYIKKSGALWKMASQSITTFFELPSDRSLWLLQSSPRKTAASRIESVPRLTVVHSSNSQSNCNCCSSFRATVSTPQITIGHSMYLCNTPPHCLRS